MTNRKTSIALGFFDGVHIAHREIILSAIKTAKERNLRALVLAFDKSPREILSDDKFEYIVSNEEKKQIITSLGGEPHFLCVTDALLNMAPEDFVKKILVDEFDAEHISCGYNYRFGKNASGTPQLLTKLGKKMGFSTDVVDCIEKYGESVSSSRIRHLLQEGNITLANELLGRNFSLSGAVVEGKHLGKTLGYPTANIYPDKNLAKPKHGVYKTIVTTPLGTFPAITNVGYNPTVGKEEFHLETYIPSFEANLYQSEIKVEFISFLRDEMKFDNIDALKEQIKKDIESIKIG